MLVFQKFAITTLTSSASSASSRLFPALRKHVITRKSSHSNGVEKEKQYRLSKIISAHASNISISRNKAERLIREGEVTLAGTPIRIPHHLVSIQEANQSGVKVGNKLLQLTTSTISTNNHSNDQNQKTESSARIWLAHKLPGELVTENDIYDRPSLLQRLRRGGVGKKSNSTNSKSNTHLKPIGRLDMQTEGLILLTNDGNYAHEMENPRNKLHRTYRVRTFGNLTPSKLHAIRKGKLVIDGIKYEKMKVTIDQIQGSQKRRTSNGGRGPANTWLRVTCTEGKNRMIRRVFDHLGLKVTRLIRISYGDYNLQTIAPGKAIEVPIKPLDTQKSKGNLWTDRYSTNLPNNRKQNKRKQNSQHTPPQPIPIQWIRNV